MNNFVAVEYVVIVLLQFGVMFPVVYSLVEKIRVVRKSTD